VRKKLWKMIYWPAEADRQINRADVFRRSANHPLIQRRFYGEGHQKGLKENLLVARYV
jgi:hypothetical protein